MLIDHNISELSDNGEFHINFNPYLDIDMKMGTWEQGLPFLLKKKGEAYVQKTHPRLTLVTEQHLSKTDLMVQWLKPI